MAFVALCAFGLQILILYAGGLQIRLNMKLLLFVAFVALCALGLQILILYAGGLQIRLNMVI
ncbi:MAG: hypothetical protein IJJ90_08135 [Prevotella sp.]|nr:hypothetical protein [Prevotella sp.]MBQ6423495.1 hypothetical protein [Prevotella sp.]